MNEEPRPKSDIPEELSKLGRQLAEAMRLAWESEDRKRLQADITEGLRRFGDQIDQATQQARDNETTKQLSEQAQRVAARVQEARVVDDVRDGIVVGLSSLNRELSRLLDHLAARSAQATEEPAAAGPIPAEPATGTPVTGEPFTPPAPPDAPPAATPGPHDPVI